MFLNIAFLPSYQHSRWPPNQMFHNTQQDKFSILLNGSMADFATCSTILVKEVVDLCPNGILHVHIYYLTMKLNQYLSKIFKSCKASFIIDLE